MGPMQLSSKHHMRQTKKVGVIWTGSQNGRFPPLDTPPSPFSQPGEFQPFSWWYFLKAVDLSLLLHYSYQIWSSTCAVSSLQKYDLFVFQIEKAWLEVMIFKVIMGGTSNILIEALEGHNVSFCTIASLLVWTWVLPSSGLPTSQNNSDCNRPHPKRNHMCPQYLTRLPDRDE